MGKKEILDVDGITETKEKDIYRMWILEEHAGSAVHAVQERTWGKEIVENGRKYEW